MQANDYQELAMRTAPKYIFEHAEDALDNAALGLCGEAGEFADILKKHFYQGHDIDETHLAKELGDILWYVSMACEALDVTMEDVMDINIKKLMARYPDGFDSNRSQHRVAGDI